VAELHVLRVFADERGAWGNPLGVFLDGDGIAATERQRAAAELGFSETVFVEDRSQGRMRIHTPATELPFAGHPTVGTAWLLAASGAGVEALRPPAGELPVRVEDDIAHVTGRPEWSPPLDYRRLERVDEVEALDPAAAREDVYAWAWLDEDAGTIRARCFAPGVGIEEDEATGSAALALCAELARPIEVRQGQGSLISARPGPDGRVEIAGRVVEDERRDFPLG
jgi:predicted PhzF superfamily epimerase YddE/YHI9